MGTIALLWPKMPRHRIGDAVARLIARDGVDMDELHILMAIVAIGGSALILYNLLGG